MRVHIGGDHAAFELKQYLQARLAGAGYEVVDHGATAYDAQDDYPGFCLACAEGVVADQARGAEALGIVLGGSGNGEVIAANKVTGARAAVIHSQETATLARQHNDANIASIGGRMHTVDECVALALLFVATPFSGAERHVRRLREVAQYEQTGELSA